MAAHKGSGEFFRVTGLSKIALRTASNAAFLSPSMTAPEQKKIRSFLSRDRINRRSSIPLVLGIQLSSKRATKGSGEKVAAYPRWDRLSKTLESPRAVVLSWTNSRVSARPLRQEYEAEFAIRSEPKLSRV